MQGVRQLRNQMNGRLLMKQHISPGIYLQINSDKYGARIALSAPVPNPATTRNQKNCSQLDASALPRVAIA